MKLNIVTNEDNRLHDIWSICEFLNKKNRIKYLIKSAELISPMWGKCHPGNKQHRKAINSGKTYLATPDSKEASNCAKMAYEYMECTIKWLTLVRVLSGYNTNDIKDKIIACGLDLIKYQNKEPK